MVAKPLKALDAPTSLNTINPAAWEGKPLPVLRWLVEDWLLATRTTYLTGEGAVGKSLLCQQLATCIATGRAFLGNPVWQCGAAYVTAEDDLEELQRRQAAINAALGISMNDLDGRLHLSSLEGESAVLAYFNPDMKVSPLFGQLEGMIEETGIQLLVLDNVAHLLAGNENDRSVVSSFVNLCNRLANRMNGAVVLIGHPNKAGAEYSGSTGWTNVVRGRLFLSIPKEKEGYYDPDGRQLKRAKFNYGRSGQAIKFRWYKGAFVREDDLPADYAGELARAAAIAQENARFLECLDLVTAQGRNVSHSKGQNYAPKIFSQMPEARGMPIVAFERALNRLLSTGEIEANKPVLRSQKNRVMKHGLKRRVHETARNVARNVHETLHDDCTNSARNPQHSARNVHETYTSPYGEENKPLEAAPPPRGMGVD